MVPMLALAINSFSPMTTSVNAQDALTGAGLAKPSNAPDSIPKMFTQIANVALYIIGALSVLMLIYGGIRYTISAGDSAGITAAKNTIMYAVIGVVVAILSYAIVNFVITNIK